jgi:serine/threonine protein kinase
MELMERGSLFNLLHGNHPIGTLSWKRKVSMAKDVACALLYLHQSNIRHCDLNSKNLLVTKELKVKGITNIKHITHTHIFINRQ